MRPLVSRSHRGLNRSHDTISRDGLMVSPPFRGETVRPTETERDETNRAMTTNNDRSTEEGWGTTAPRLTPRVKGGNERARGQVSDVDSRGEQR
jgi:hypothetical protein